MIEESRLLEHINKRYLELNEPALVGELAELLSDQAKKIGALKELIILRDEFLSKEALV